MKRRLFPLFLLLLLAGGLESVSAEERTYNVLFIQSHTEHPSRRGVLTKNLIRGLEKEGLSVNVTTEYVNADNWYFASELFILRRICERARQRGTDLIVTYGDEAFFDLAHCGDSLGYRLPVVVSDMNYPDSATIAAMPNVCGFITMPNFDLLLEAAIRIFPSRKQLICLTENSFLNLKGAKALVAAWERIKTAHPDFDLRVLNVDDRSMNDIITTMCYDANAFKHTIVAPRWLPFLSLKLKSPVFIGQNLAVTNDALCAYDDIPGDDAFAAGQQAARVLRGESPRSIGFTKLGGKLLFDYKQLRYFGVDVSTVEREGLVLGEPFMERYSIWFLLFDLLLIVGLIVWGVLLFIANRKERRFRKETQMRLLIQQHLVEQRDEFEHLLCSIRDGMITYGFDLRIRFVNTSMMQLLNLPADLGRTRSYEGKPAGTIFAISVDGEDMLRTLLTEVRDTKRPVAIPERAFMVEKQSGRYFPVSGEVVPVLAGEKPVGMALVCRNISEEEIQKRFFTMAVEESSIYPYQYDIRQELFYFQDDWLQRFGTTGGEGGSVTRGELESRIHVDDFPQVSQGFAPVLSGKGSNARINFRLKNKEGKYEWWEFRSTTYDGMTAGTPYKVLGICQSIQRYKDTEEELIRARDRALQSDRLKSAFLANMSHEIRTPLNAIVGFSDLLSDLDSFSREEIQQFIETININCTLLLALINDILDLSRIESGTMEFKFLPVQLSDVMHEVYESQRLSVREGVELRVELPAEGRTVVTDPIRLKQVMNNLINNAKKFTAEGSITFGYTGSDRQECIDIFVADTGRGISQEAQKHIFERFYKEDSFTQGTGLGLSICQTIVSHLKGTIAVTSTKGKGTRFDVVIPNDPHFTPPSN